MKTSTTSNIYAKKEKSITVTSVTQEKSMGQAFQMRSFLTLKKEVIDNRTEMRDNITLQ